MNKKAQGLGVDITTLVVFAAVIIVVGVYILGTSFSGFNKTAQDCDNKGGRVMTEAECKLNGGSALFEVKEVKADANKPSEKQVCCITG